MSDSFVQVSQPNAPSTPNPGFFQGSSNVNASHGVFTYVAGNQINTNAINLEMAENACLEKLPRAMKAGYSSGNHRTCLKGTREAVLLELEAWGIDLTDKSVYWLKGVAGCGKSTIAQTLAERFAANGHLGASFFCSRDYPDRRNLHLIFPTLAYQLAYRYMDFKTNLVHIFLSDPDVVNDSLAVQFEKLIVRPLQQTQLAVTIVIDALDECEDEEPVSAFLSALARYIEEIPNIKFFITGRPEDHIRSGFKIQSLRTKELPLHDVESATVDSDIKAYVKTNLEQIAARKSLCISGPWPSEKDLVTVLNKSNGLFIIASVIVRFIDYPYATPQDRLNLIVTMPDSTIYEGKSGIDVTYNKILAASFKDVEDDDSEFFDQLHLVVGYIVLAVNPLPRASLARILGISSERIWNVLSRLHSVLIVPESDSEPIRILHKSFADFITDPQRCVDARYCIDAAAHHLKLGTGCLELMKTTLKKNLCRLPRYVMNNDVKDLPKRRERYIGASLTYACSSWAKHLQSSSKVGDDSSNILDLVTSLFENHFLAWLEVLSIEGNFHVAIYSLQGVRSWLTDIKSRATSLFDLVDDFERFVLRFFDVMRRSATHVYHSALPWSPTSSLIRRLYQNELITEAKLLNAVDTTWDACTRIIPAYDRANEVVFSHTGALIALRGTYGVNVLDTSTGVSRAAFGVHTFVFSIAFSPDDSLLVLGHECGIVTVRDLQTGSMVRTFEGHRGEVLSVAFSPCGSMVASGADDATVLIWNMSSGRCEFALEGNFWSVRAVCYSETGDQIISASYDTVRVWDASKRTCLKTLREPNVPVTAIASSRGTLLVVSSKDNDTSMTVYDSQFYDIIHTTSIKGSIQSVRSSIDRDEIMYTSGNTGYIWDMSRKTHMSTIDYDGDWAVFSPDGTCVASRSGDFVKIWKTKKRGGRHLETSVHHSGSMKDVSFSLDGQLMVSRSRETTEVWDATTGRELFTFDNSANLVVLSPNFMFLACLSKDVNFLERRLVRVWNVYTRSQVKSIEVDYDVRRIALSSDGSQLVSQSYSSITLWDLANKERLAVTTPIFLFWSAQLEFAPDGTSVFLTSGNTKECLRIYPASAPNGWSKLLKFNLSSRLPMIFVPTPEARRPLDVSVPDKSYRCKQGDEWIVDQDERRLLWVPPDERARLRDIHEKKIIVETGRGRLFIVDFSAVSLS